jgi:hypothetical protein
MLLSSQKVRIAVLTFDFSHEKALSFKVGRHDDRSEPWQRTLLGSMHDAAWSMLQKMPLAKAILQIQFNPSICSC